MSVLRNDEGRTAPAGAPSPETPPKEGQATVNAISRGPTRAAESPASDRPHEDVLRAARVRLEQDERLLGQGFLHVRETGEYHWRDHAEEGKRSLAFRDVGGRLVSEGQEKMVVEGMVALAQQKGWTTLQVSGTEEFRRSVWRSAHERGIAVEGYQPTPTD
ncbi:MAG: LPD7 domain-containing protein, partial [Acidimicrobiales bacterium]